jgi:trimethylamine--corrinoid protein Co-methyltransferase
MLNFYNILNNEQVQTIHSASLTIMETIGLGLDHEGALKKLADKGVKVDFEKKRVYFNEDQVKAALNKAPSSFNYGARNKKYNRIVTPGKISFCRALGGAPKYFDVFSGETRALTPQDCIELTTLVDSLPHLDIITTPTIKGFPLQTYDIHTLATIFRHTEKHISALTVSSKNLKYQLQIAEIISGSKEKLKNNPVMDGIVTMIDPYFMPRDEVERLILYGEYNVPVHLVNVPITGATAPYTLSGTIAEINAEFLMGTTLINFLTPNLPHFYYLLPKAMDMKTASILGPCSPENQLVIASIAQLARHYNIPSCISAGGGECCQPHQILHQYGSAINMAMLCGATEIIGLGQLAGSMQCSPVMIAIANEAIAFSKRIMNGYDMSVEAIGIDAMQRVDIKGNFVGDKHTFDHLRKEEKFTSKIFDWCDHGKWSLNGKTSIIDRAQEEVQKILAQHENIPLDAKIDKEIGKLLSYADNELADV